VDAIQNLIRKVELFNAVFGFFTGDAH
ncbi:MAG: hypothetical protein RL440_1, partial [Bacteroidota bacterium]